MSAEITGNNDVTFTGNTGKITEDAHDLTLAGDVTMNYVAAGATLVDHVYTGTYGTYGTAH